VAKAGTSIHLTVGVAAVTGADVVRELTAELARRPELRAPLPIDGGDAGPEVLERAVREVIAAFAGAVEGELDGDGVTEDGLTGDGLTGDSVSRDGLAKGRLAGDDLTGDDRAAGGRVGDGQAAGGVGRTTAAVRRSVQRMSRPEPVAPLATLAAAGDLAPKTVVRLPDGLAVTVEVDAEGVLLAADGQSLRLPAACDLAIRALTSGERVWAGALPGLDEADSLVVARRLLRSGLLVSEPGD
jgi:bifunctional lysine-specific demethylase and histidyl-hydroxylase NO66